MLQDGAGMHLLENQMYVEKLVPNGGSRRKAPIIFIHGQAQTGTVSLKAVVLTVHPNIEGKLIG